MDQFADQLRKARQLGALAPGRGQARLAAQSLQAQEAIVRAMTPLERARPEEVRATPCACEEALVNGFSSGLALPAPRTGAGTLVCHLGSAGRLPSKTDVPLLRASPPACRTPEGSSRSCFLGRAQLDAAQRARVAAECSCTAADVDAVIANYQWAREAERKVSQLKEAGKPLPQTMQEIEALVGSRARFRPGAQTEPSRNAPCPCGSGAKFKR
eukprot:SM000005S17229  [mRNA]  locus=s5:888914:889975:+ [translate_table: standard]